MKHRKPEPISACPFCASADTFVERMDYSASAVQCNECGAFGPTCNREDSRDPDDDGACAAIRAWNRRPATPDHPQDGTR